MILRRTEPYDPLCERCLKLTRVTCAVVAFELAPDVQTLVDTGRLLDPTLYSRGLAALCAGCAKIVEEDGGLIKGCNASGYPLDPTHSWYRT
jgi:5-methylcytosine-specific restriction enzyme A